MNHRQTYRESSLLMLDGWELCMYATVGPFLVMNVVFFYGGLLSLKVTEILLARGTWSIQVCIPISCSFDKNVMK